MILESLEGRTLLAGDGAQVVDVNENSSLVLDIDDVGNIVAAQPGSLYSISGGADAALFEIDETTGILSFVSAPDFESPLDEDTDNLYVVQVTLTDASSASQSIDLCAQVVDVSGLTLNHEILDLDASDYTIVRNGGSIEIRETATGTVFSSSPANDTSLIQILGSANLNTLVIDFTGGPFGGVIEFNGGDPTTNLGDTLELVGDPAESIEHVFTNASSGSVDIDFGAGSVLVTYTGLEPIIDNLSAVDRVFTFNGGDETITLSDDAVADDDSIIIDSDLSESVVFVSPSNSLRVNSSSGTDVIQVNSLDSMYKASLIIDGGAGSDDSLEMTNVDLINTPGRGLHVVELEVVNVTGGTISRNTAPIGGGVLVDNSTSGTITDVVLTDVTISNNVATGDSATEGGGGIYNNGAKLSIAGTSLIRLNQANGVAGSGGGILSNAGELLLSSGTVVSGNSANRAGGGIEIIAGTATLRSVTIGGPLVTDGNSAGINGGGLHISGAGAVTLNGGTISNNVANAEGGGLWNSSTGSLILEASDSAITISSNSANGNFDPNSGPSPSPSLLQGGGGVFNDGGTLTLDGSTHGISIDGNLATGVDFGSGGGLLTIGGTVSIINTTFLNNSAIRAGGGIEVIVGNVTLTDSSLINNGVIGAASPGNGGGLHTTGAALVTLNGGSVFGNEAAQEGGGLWNSATGTMRVNNTTIDGNIAASGAGDTVAQGGGGIFNNGGILEIIGAFIVGNEALDPDGSATQDDGGGGIFNLGGSVTITNTEITNNLATSGLGNGGGILTFGGSLTINGGTIRSNSAARAGGGVEVLAGTASLSNVTIGGLFTTDANNAGINGGGVHTSGDSTVTIRGGSVQNNIAGQEGGGLWNSSAGSLDVLTSSSGGTLIRSNIANGNSTEQGGGGVFNDGGEVTIDGAAIIQNVATATAVGNGGGGIFNDGRMIIANSIVVGNAASSGLGNGGGILNSNGGVLEVASSRIASNIAARAGGGIENVAGTVTLTDTELGGSNLGDGNVANINGGGLHISGTGIVEIFGGSIVGNTAGQEGGGVWNSATGLMSIETSLTGNTLIRGNIASGNGPQQGGGGAFNDGGTLSFTGASIIANSATSAVTGNGGGGVMSVGGNLNLMAVELSGNSANFGGAINNLGTASIVNTTLANNTASLEGGGVYNGVSGSTTIISTTIAGNSAVDGAGISNDGTFVLNSTLVAGNTSNTLIDDDLSGSFAGSYNLIGQSVADFGSNNLIDVDWKTVLENDGANVTLKNNGGPTRTIHLLSNSPAIDAGISSPTDPLVDQRGVARVIDLAAVPNATAGNGTDIGALEVVGISIGNAVANEADGTLNFEVSLSHPVPIGATVTVQLSTSDGSALAVADYTAIVGQLVTFVGGGSLTETVSVTLRNDVLVEIDETFQAALSNSVGGAIAVASATGTITDNDTAGFVLNKSTASVSESGAIDTFTVVLSARPASDVMITITSGDAGEVTIGASNVSTSSLTFTPSNWNQPQGVALVGTDDPITDGIQSTAITVSVDDANSNPLFAAVADQIVTATTTDNEVAGFTLSLASPTVSETETTTTITVVLNSRPISDVVLNISNSDVSEVMVDLTSITFTTLNWNQPQTVTVTGVDDFVDDGNLTVSINVAVDAANSDNAFDNVLGQSLSVTNTDNDTAGITLSNTTATTSEAGGTDSFNVVLDSQPLSNVVITLASNDTGEAIPNVPSITFTPVNWNTPQTVTVTGLDDLVDDGNETLLITLSVNDSASAIGYQNVANKLVTVTNIDNDTAGFTLSKTTSTVSESGTTDTFSVVLTSRPITNVVVLVSSGDTGEVTTNASSVTFDSTDWDTPRTVTLTGVADNSFDGNQTTLVSVRVDDANSDNGFDGVPDQVTSVVTVDIDPPTQDFGDAPTAAQSGFTNSYPVTLAQDGARHTRTSLFLGSGVNGEVDGQPTAQANGDGISDDGVTTIASQLRTTAAATRSSFRVSATQSGKLDGWIDFNRDGDWTDSGEQILTSVDLQPGTNLLTYTIPAGATSGSTAARFRLSTAGGLAPTGSANDGEVEDYLYTIVNGDSPSGVTINVVNGLIVLKRDNSDTVVSSGVTELFRVLATSIASLNIIGTATNDTVTIDFGSGLTLPSGGATIAGAAGSNTLALQGAGSVDLTSSNVAVSDFGSIDLSLTELNTLTLNAAAIDRLSPSTKTVSISAGTNSVINLADASNWRMTTSTVSGGEFTLNAINSIGGQIIQVNSPLAWRNFIAPSDVNNSGDITAADALAIIFELNQPQFSSPITGQLNDPLAANPFPGIYFDRSGDGRVSALDALIVINDLFQEEFGGGGGEGERLSQFNFADFIRQHSSTIVQQTSSEPRSETNTQKYLTGMLAVPVETPVSTSIEIASNDASEKTFDTEAIDLLLASELHVNDLLF